MPDANGIGQTSVPSAHERTYLAEIVTGFSLIGITIMAAIVLAKSWSDKDIVRYVFASIIPLLASWMGTILAFYFSKENFIAATQSVTDLTRTVTGVERLKTIPVTEKMRPLNEITSEQVLDGDEDKKKLSELLNKFKDLERIPILDDKSKIRFLIYKGMIDKYLAKFAGSTSPPSGKQVTDLTLKDLLESSDEMRKLFEQSFGFVPKDATMAEAKREMEKIDKCGDIFVTNTGKRSEPILGWITDNTIIENSRV
jgi:hypothetical protein